MLMARMVATIKQVGGFVILLWMLLPRLCFTGLAFSAFILTILPLSGLGGKVVSVKCFCLIFLPG